MNGASQLEVAEVLGHRTLQMVRRYAQLSESHVNNLMEELNEKFFLGQSLTLASAATIILADA